MDESDLGRSSRHFTSSAQLPSGGRQLSPHLRVLECEFLKPMARNDGARQPDDLVSAMADARKMERALRGE
jgi:hypothetical protein